MDRMTIWLCLAGGGVIYQVIKSALGLEISIMQLIDGIYWSGIALGWHWWESKP